MAISRSSISKEISTSLSKRKKKKRRSKVPTVMKEFKAGKLHSGSKKGPKVKSPKQAIAIALSEERKRKKKKSKKKRK
jgi:hypothetical protein|tara:strand:+ start:2012 stop:2245 length:234 start_codon:yes stop_codon:yes gene_type:complete